MLTSISQKMLCDFENDYYCFIFVYSFDANRKKLSKI